MTAKQSTSPRQSKNSGAHFLIMHGKEAAAVVVWVSRAIANASKGIIKEIERIDVIRTREVISKRLTETGGEETLPVEHIRCSGFVETPPKRC